ncbi:MAG: GTPase domain-containing protein [Acetobacteraceae bacterium]|nr:GTPase domain-containing protein [Acetobacteraceae bacterium]
MIWSLFAAQAGNAAVGRDEAERQALLRASFERAPVVWLLGKAGAGKTSVIAALTGDSTAEIGRGFAPCTRSTRLYRWPNAPDAPALLRFLDTRGLGEAGYDPAEDIAYAEGQAHLLIAVLSIADPSQDEVVETVRQARARHPEWPLIVAQSHLHRGYPADARRHPERYPYRGDESDLTDPAIPAPIRAALKAQRGRFAGLPGPPPRFVPLDLTRPEDGLEPADFGADALRSALREAGAEAVYNILRQMWDAGQSETEQRAAAIVWAAAAAAGAAGAVPVPAVGMAGVPGIIAGMRWQLAETYKVEMDVARWSAFFGTLGSGVLLTFAARYGLGELLKLVPGIGTVAAGAMNAAAAFGLVFGIGAAARAYLRDLAAGRAVDPEAIREAFRKAFDSASRRPPGAADPPRS